MIKSNVVETLLRRTSSYGSRQGVNYASDLISDPAAHPAQQETMPWMQPRTADSHGLDANLKFLKFL